MNHRPPEPPPAPADLASFRDFRRDLVALQARRPDEIRQAFDGARRWRDVLPALRYLGELPCWRADCPRCGAADDLWVSVWEDIPGIPESWTCGGCNAKGDDAVSLAAFIAGPGQG